MRLPLEFQTSLFGIFIIFSCASLCVMLHQIGTRRVRIDGIASRPEMNGQLGTAVSFIEDKERYAILLDSAGPDGGPISFACAKVHRILSVEEVAAVPSALPNADIFKLYCDSFPTAKQDGAFQAKHLHLAVVDVGDPNKLLRMFPMARCEGCPECLFGTSFMELHRAQKEHPCIVNWQALSSYQGAPGAGKRLLPNEAPPLRFAVGQEVLCTVGGGPGATGIAAGTVVKLFYGFEGEEEGWPEGFWLPYQIRLHHRFGEPELIDELIFAPADMDDCVRAMPVWRHGDIFCCAECAMDTSGSVIG